MRRAVRRAFACAAEGAAACAAGRQCMPDVEEYRSVYSP